LRTSGLIPWKVSENILVQSQLQVNNPTKLIIPHFIFLVMKQKHSKIDIQMWQCGYLQAIYFDFHHLLEFVVNYHFKYFNLYLNFMLHSSTKLFFAISYFTFSPSVGKKIWFVLFLVDKFEHFKFSKRNFFYFWDDTF